MDGPSVEQRLLTKVGFREAPHFGGIAPEYAIALFQMVLAKSPTTVLEVGMGHGASTIAILSALSELGGERLLISVDPNQSGFYANVGLNNVEANGFSRYHRLIEEPDYLALPDLLRQQLAPGVAYVDGWHTFDYVPF